MLKIMMIAFALLFIFALSEGKWATPITVVPAYNGLLSSVFTDNTTQASHVLWCDDSTRRLSHRRVNPDGSMSDIHPFPQWKAPCLTNHFITGLGDGKTIFIVYQGYRSRSPRGNCKDNADSCSDVFISESKDAGDNWSTLVAVPRIDMNDHENRQFPQVVTNKQGRVWIFYRMGGFYESPLTFVTRSPGSAVFAQETKLPIVIDSFSVSYGLIKTGVVLSVFYSTHSSIKKYHYYTNNMVKWEGPVDVTDFCPGEAFEAMPQTTPGTPRYLYLSCRNQDYKTHLKVSADWGKTWREAAFPPLPAAYQLVAAGDGDTKGWYGFAYHDVLYKHFGEEDYRQLTKLPIPTMAHSFDLTATYGEKKNGAWFWYEVNGVSHTITLMVTWNDNIDEATVSALE